MNSTRGKHEATGFASFGSRWTQPPQGSQVWPLLVALFPPSYRALVCWLVLLGFVCVQTKNHKLSTLAQHAPNRKDSAKVQPNQLFNNQQVFCHHPTEGTTFSSLSPRLLSFSTSHSPVFFLHLSATLDLVLSTCLHSRSSPRQSVLQPSSISSHCTPSSSFSSSHLCSSSSRFTLSDVHPVL